MTKSKKFKKTNSIETSSRIAKDASKALREKVKPSKKMFKELGGSALVR